MELAQHLPLPTASSTVWDARTREFRECLGQALAQTRAWTGAVDSQDFILEFQTLRSRLEAGDERHPNQIYTQVLALLEVAVVGNMSLPRAAQRFKALGFLDSAPSAAIKISRLLSFFRTYSALKRNYKFRALQLSREAQFGGLNADLSKVDAADRLLKRAAELHTI